MTDTLANDIIGISTTIVSNFQIVVALLLMVVIEVCFLGRQVEFSKKLILSAFGITGVTLICTVLVNIFFADADSDLVLVLQYFIAGIFYAYAFVFFLVAFKEKRLKRAVEAWIWFFLFNQYISTFSNMTVFYLVGGTDELAYVLFYEKLGIGPIWLAMTSANFIFTLALFLITYFGFYKPKKYCIINVPARVLFIVWIVTFLFMPIIPVLIPSEFITFEERYHIMSVMFGLGIIILGLAAPVFVVISSAERSYLEKNKAQEAYISAELEYIEQYKRKQTETRAFRHDINNQLAMTQMMLEEGHSDQAKEHIRDMLGNISSLSPKYVSGDEMLDIIISMKADKMDELNIRFALDGVADGGLKIKPMDMCSIFANALDNAIEAASSCEDPFVSFSIKRTDKFFVFRITNSASGKVDIEKLLNSTGYTSKKDKESHGFGLMNVRRTVETCDGILKASSEENTFVLSIMLPRPL